MKLVVFHYHLLPGGVTQVISSSAIAVLKYLPEIEEITLVSGEKDNTENVTDSIKKKLGSIFSPKPVINCVTLPELGYISEMTRYPNPESIKTILNKHFSGDLWWIHNYHLGKNPFFTEALIQSARENPGQKIVLQIHDFPEASRYSNMEILLKHVSSPLYPVLPNIRYVTINSRDRNYLITAGIPEDMVFLLNNPIESLQEEKPSEDTNSYTKIDKFLSSSEPSYIKGAPLMIYPVRSIRRKNVLEAGLLAKCSTIPVNILSTLPGVSKPEMGYSKIVDNCFREKLIPGASKAGILLESEGFTFNDIIKSSKIIISSSVQEGFGYLFINSLQWRKPLIARKLDIMTDFSDIFHSDFSYFYNNINIPVSSALRKQLLKEYNNKISGLGKFLNKDLVSSLKSQAEQTIREDKIDFSYLSPIMQRQFLRNLNDKNLLEETRSLNVPALSQIEKLLAVNSMTFEETDIENFSLSNHAEQIGNIIFSLKYNSQKIPPTKKNINYNLLTSFTNLPSISLLFNPV